MTKKRFSILINENTPKQEQTTFVAKEDKSTEDRARFSIMDNEEEKQEKQEKTPFKRKLTYWFIQNETVFLHRTYGIYINYNHQKSIQYLLEVKCEGYKKGVFIYTLIRKRFFKNGKQLEGVLEELAEKSIACLYPLQINVNNNGQIIDVANQEKIEKRWKELQPKLSKFYAGKPFQKHCKKITETVSSSENILKSLQNDVVYDILFSKLYFNYSKAFTKPLEKEFKWFSGIQKIRFIGKQTIIPILKENMRMLINYKGIMYPTAGLKDGNTKIQYQLNSNDHTLLRVDGTFNYTNNNTDKIIEFKAIWQENMDKTEARKIEDKKRKGIYIAPDSEKKWWQVWKY